MTRFWQIISYEYKRHVFRKRFIFALLSVPLLVAFIGVTMIIVFSLQNNAKPIGYVDQSECRLLANPIPQEKPKYPDVYVPMQAFASEAEADTALQDGKLQAYYILESDYCQTSRVRQVSVKPPKRPAADQFHEFILINLLANQPAEIAARVRDGSSLTVRTPDGSREMGDKDWINLLLPVIGGFVFVIAIFTSAGYLMQAVAEEKENRTMEIIATSISPAQFLAGKTIAIVGIALTQIATWIIFLVVAVLVGRNYISWLNGIHVPLDIALLFAITMLPAFVMLCALMAAVGAVVNSAQEGQQIASLLSMPMWIPYMLISVLMSAPNGLISVIMSFFPLTAPLTLIFRSTFTVVPLWQVIVCVAELCLCAIGMVWLAGRIFRMGMLRYGKSLSLREIFSRSARASVS